MRGYTGGKCIIYLLLFTSTPAVWAQENATVQEFVFPVVESGFLSGEVGPRFEVHFGFLNLSLTAFQATLQFFDNEGRSIQVFGETTVRTNITGGKSLTWRGWRFAPVVPPMIPPRISGWGRLTVPVDVTIEAQNQIAFIKDWLLPVFTSIHLRAVKPARNFQIILTEFERLGKRAGLAIVNPSAMTAANIRIESQSFSGCPIALSLAPRNRVSKFLDELCGPVSGSRDASLVDLTSDVAVAVTAIEVLSDGIFSTVPVQPK